METPSRPLAGSWSPLRDDFWQRFLAHATSQGFKPRIVVWRGTECTCCYGGTMAPEFHAMECEWRKLAEKDRAVDAAETSGEYP